LATFARKFREQVIRDGIMHKMAGDLSSHAFVTPCEAECDSSSFCSVFANYEKNEVKK
jgi:hypothetical protein